MSKKSTKKEVSELDPSFNFILQALGLIAENKTVTENQIFMIKTQMTFGDFIVKRVNQMEFEVINNGVIVFKGKDFEVEDYINNSSASDK